MSGSPIPPPGTLPEEEHYPPRKRKRRPGPLPPLWSILVTVLIAVALAGCAIAGFIALGSGTTVHSQNAAMLQITAALPTPSPSLNERFGTPSATPDLASTAALVQSIDLIGPTLVPTHTATPTAISIAVGAQIIVISQGGVNVRSQPGTNNTRNFVANFNQTFQVIGGPQKADDLTWWQIRDPRNNKTGWIAENDGLSDLIEVYIP